MPKLIALRAMFGQDEANHGTARYRVGIDGLVTVPPEVAVHLISNGGFTVANPTAARHLELQRGDLQLGPLVRLHHDTAASCSYGGGEYRADKNGDVLVPAAAVVDLMAHEFMPVQPEEARHGQVSNPIKSTPEAEPAGTSTSLGS
jgi:hypothetical protein